MLPDPRMSAEEPRRYVGTDVRRRENERLVRGFGRYVDDIDRSGLLHGHVVRSVHANARIRAIDVDAARSLPGVHLILTADDLAELDQPLPLLASHPSLLEPRTQRPLARDRVRYVGEAVAFIVADDRYVAEDAGELVRVDYDPIPAVVDLDDAATTSDRVHDDVPSNIAAIIEQVVGDPDAVFASAPFTERLHLSIERSCGSPLEGRGVLADWDPREEILRVWDSTQAPISIGHGLARLLGLPRGRVEVVAPDVGGGFGTKIMLFYPEEILVPLAAMRLGRAIKWTEDRSEHFVSANQERGQVHDAEIAFDKDGRLLAVRTNFDHDTGAYIPYGIAVPAVTGTHLLGQYQVSNYRFRGRVLYTNKPPVSPYRGAGRPQGVFVMERLIGAVARRLNLEPWEIRRRNLISDDAFPYDVGLTLQDGSRVEYDSGSYRAGFERAIEALDPDGFRQAQANALRDGRHLGIGMATYVEGTGVGPYEGCSVRLDPTGQIVVTVAVPSQGQGHQTAFAQIAADVLGCRMEQIDVRAGDGLLHPDGTGTFGSRGIVMSGNAVVEACRDLRRQLAAYAAELLEGAPEDVVFEDGLARISGSPEPRISIEALALAANSVRYAGAVDALRRLAMEGVAAPRGASPSFTPTFQAHAYHHANQWTFGSGVHGAVVEVDPISGLVRILRYVVVHDCGVMINPGIVEGQIVGGLMQGIGGALLERLDFDASGQPKTTSFMDFRLPTVSDLPPLELIHLETPSPLNPLGVKGTGEAGIIPVSAVLSEAIEDALRPFDVHIDHMPLLPADIANLAAGSPGRRTA